MLKKRVSAVHAVANAFIATEGLVDRAATEAVRCMAVMMEQRASADLPMPTGMDALAHVSRATALLVQARQSFIDAHLCLDQVPRQIGLERMYGKDANNPPNGPGRIFVGATIGDLTTIRD